MKGFDYLPKDDRQLSVWLVNFSKTISVFGTSLGITPAEVSALNALISSLLDDIRKGKLEEKKGKKESTLRFLTVLVGRLKTNINYNKDDHGRKLGIE